MDFDLLMRQSGRIRETVSQYLLREELAGRIVQIMAEAQLEQEDLKRVLKVVVEEAATRAGREEERI